MGAFRILFVCRANRCRSAVASLLLNHAIQVDPGLWPYQWAVESAGTEARDGEPMDPRSAALLEQTRVPTSEFRSRLITAAMVVESDLVLTADRRRRADVVELVPRAANRVFTMRQFARLMRDDVITVYTAELGLQAVAVARSRRGMAEPADPAVDDIEDPAGRPARVLNRALERIAQSLQPLGVTFQPGRARLGMRRR
ncbi:MAG: hypothetical protein M3Y35_14235 [Actinomycetota bacterium]|nr:hypothetical protein [Actinomycetota bacterium]